MGRQLKSTVVPFPVPTRRRLHQDIAEQLRDAILDGRIAAGEKLPPERELAERFHVNRTSVREAIKVLEGLGLVVVRQGDGATVQPLVDASFSILAPMIFHGGRVDTPLLVELNEVVLPLLFEMGRLAIARHRPEHVRAIRALRDVVADETNERDVRFGALRDLVVLLADMTGNRVWQMLGRRMRELLASEPLRMTRERLRRDPTPLVPLIDAALEALDHGRPNDAVRNLEALIRALGDADMKLRPEPRRRVTHRRPQ